MRHRQFFVIALTVLALFSSYTRASDRSDVGIDALIDRLLGYYQADVPGGQIYHKLVEVAAPRLGQRVVYHQIAREGFDSVKPMIQKFYVFDRSVSSDRRVVTTALSVRANTVAANAEASPAALAVLDAKSLQNFPAGCELVWRLQNDGAWIAAPAARRCRYFSDTMQRTIVAELEYRLSEAAFAMHDVLRGVDGKLIFADPGVIAAARVPARTVAQIVGLSRPNEWRQIDPKYLLRMMLTQNRTVLIELAPQLAPLAVANILTLTRQGYFDGLSVNRVQDNFVVQWGDADGKRSLGSASRTLTPEFERDWQADLPFTPLPDRDGFAPQVGFLGGMPAGGDRALGKIWGAHCYGTIGVGRDNDASSGNGSELYAVIGHSPRQLDRNIAVVGRVVRGMELLSALPRGPGAMGFYDGAAARTLIESVRVVADLPAAQQPLLTALRDDSASFSALVEARRNRRDDWYKSPAGHVDLCNVPLPVR